jgi:hypothetical protein
MPKRLLEGMRILVAILLIALYAFGATTSALATAANPICASHPCCEAEGLSHPHDDGGYARAHARQHVPHHASMSADHARDGKAPHHAEPDCGFGCSAALWINADDMAARRSAASAAFLAHARDPDDHAPERLIRPPRFPLA